VFPGLSLWLSTTGKGSIGSPASYQVKSLGLKRRFVLPKDNQQVCRLMFMVLDVLAKPENPC